MRILGISDHFISGAAIIEDSRIVAAINEERLARKKMVMGFPRKSIEAVLRVAGVRPDELDFVAIASEWGHFLDQYVDFDNGVFGVDEGVVRNLFFSMGSRLSTLRTTAPVLERLYYDLRRPAFARRRTKIRHVLREEFDIRCPVEFISHHFAHAAGAYYSSGFGDALVVTLDGAGDGQCSQIYAVRDDRWEHLHSIPSFDSVGDYYAYVTQICGFKAGKHEGKITGLAAYGKPVYRELFDRFIRYQNGTIRNVGNAFRFAALKKLADALPTNFSKEDLAASIQAVAEDISTRYILYWRKRTNLRNVALAGGVFANVKINQRIHELEDVDSVFVYPAMSDEGIAAGAALVLSSQRFPGTKAAEGRCLHDVYLGPEFSEEEIARALSSEGVDFVHRPDVDVEVARLVSAGYVVARVAGRMEYGPRALGNRSILYRPDEPAVNDWLNKRLHRTEFMPFAPSTIAEDAGQYFTGLEGARDTARFMTITFNCTELMKKQCPGVVHVDGTARPQLVSESDNPGYYRIIKEFHRLTGLSCIVNTSFNIHEEPIVCTPQDAVRAFLDGHLDVLAIGSFIAKHAEANARVAANPAPGLESANCIQRR
jgi:carbamoyltransferase